MLSAGRRAQVLDVEAPLPLQPRRDQRAVAGLGVALDAEQRRRAGADPADDRAEVDGVEDLLGVALGVAGGDDGARALALAAPGVLAVLQLAQLGGPGQLLAVAVADGRPPLR